MTSSDQKLTSKINPYKMIYPILIGLAVVAYMFYREFEPGSFQLIHFTWLSAVWLIIAMLCMVIRDVGYIIRIRILSDNKLSWYQSLRIIMLWEFTSAVTPSAVGGTSLAILFVHKENISVGRSSAIVMATSFLDELYFILMFPIILLSVNEADLWDMPNVVTGISRSLISIALIGYFLKLGYLIILCYGLFYNPRGLKFFLLRIFKLRFLKRWKYQANVAGTDIVRNSYKLRKKSFIFWLKTFGSTFVSWTARYCVVNAILIAFWAGNYDWAKQFLIFARQLIMWIMMLVSPTPGGSGFAEFVFKEYLGEFIPSVGVAVAIALLWRLISYYPYLLIGAFLVPKWIRNNFGKKTH